MNIYKVVDLKGGIETKKIPKKKTSDIFKDYDSFVEKFKLKKTTDDCYTPKEVYQTVLDYIAERIDLTGKEIIRPFYPEGDYENIDYTANSVIIDNPPFSKVSEITRFYVDRGIPFFLFAPHMTLFSADIQCNHIVVGADVIFENGAKVKISFLSNMFGDAQIIGDPVLLEKLNKCNTKFGKNKKKLNKYKYPENICTVSQIEKIVSAGVPIIISHNSTKFIRALNHQKKHKKSIFGSGYLLSNKATKEKKAKEKKAKAKNRTLHWKLDESEIIAIEKLN